MPKDQAVKHIAKHKTNVAELISELESLRKLIVERTKAVEPELKHLLAHNLPSARNLVHYLVLRQHDLRKLQHKLALIGASSLGRSESCVLATITAVLRLLYTAEGAESPQFDLDEFPDLDEGRKILKRRTRALLGKTPKNRKVRIMVTFPSEAADDRDLVRDLVAGGMDCARINCAHDGPNEWIRMIENIRAAEAATGKSCKICMDIAGPKLRTGSLGPGPQLVRWKPARDAFGRASAPAQIWIGPAGSQFRDPDLAAKLYFPAEFIDKLTAGETLKFEDTRGSKRSLTITKKREDGFVAECADTSYVCPDTVFTLGSGETSRPAEMDHLEQFIVLRKGDMLVLTDDREGTPAELDDAGVVKRPPRVPCTLPEVFEFVKKGEFIWFDDGKIGGVVESAGRRELTVKVVYAGPKGTKLKADKGINLPDSRLRLNALTRKDIEDLEFITQHADMVGFSFVRSADDVHELQKKLKEKKREDLGIILKIETKTAFANLPEIVLSSMRSHAAGVMIARGDLAVESGFGRMAEVQEEILWMCEAAHMPVIWATQVLEQLTKKGIGSRAEITDAAMSERAECVMLNKGPFVLETVHALDEILTRMAGHQDKKRAMYRPLHLAESFFEQYKK